MSAFVCDKAHINAMVKWAVHSRYELVKDGDADKVGQMLLDENVNAVGIRYHENSITELPGRADKEFLIPFKYNPWCRRPTAVEVLKLIQCYEYQSCEDPEFDKTEAHKFCERLTHHAIACLNGYDEAPWEWTPKHAAGISYLHK